MFKKVLQSALVVGLLIGGVAANAPVADAKVVAKGKTGYAFSEQKGSKIKFVPYTWDQKKVGKYTYHTLDIKSPYIAKVQYIRVMMFKKDSKGVETMVRSYEHKIKTGKAVSLKTKSKTSSKGVYHYVVSISFPYPKAEFAPSFTTTKYVTIK